MTPESNETVSENARETSHWPFRVAAASFVAWLLYLAWIAFKVIYP